MSLCRLAGLVALAILTAPLTANAATISVPAGGSLQAAIDAARAGDTILLQPGATYAGNFRLPVHGGTAFITIRSGASDALLPAAGVRMTPAYAAYLPKIISTNNVAAIRTAPGASYWRLMFLEIGPTANPTGTVVDLGDGSSAQNALSLVPQELMVDRVYIHGDATNGQRRGIGLNSASTTIVNSHISEMKSVAQDSQAIGGWNGPGPFRIENNYLEGAGEVVMFGGDDPRIPNLTPSDIVLRYNTLSRPLAWRNPILATPQNVRATLAGPGGLAASTYAYRVVARRSIAGTIVRSLAAAQTSVTTGAGGAVQIAWNAVPGATEYLVYGRTPGAQDRYWRTVSTSLVDDGTNAGTAGTSPTTATVWQVKNLLELKHARRVQIDHNLLENNWAQAQTGSAILFTPRNQYGGCTWCVVEDVVFEYNVVRRMGGGIQLLGWDDERPSQQTNNIVIRHNEFSELNKSWGGSAYFLYVIDGPRNVTVDHNTVISPVGAGAIIADKRPAEGFVFTNNVMRHNTYGIIGSNTAPGMGSITFYFPGSVITRNVLAGGSASLYPAGNQFPTIASFEGHFVNYLAADYALAPATDWAGAGTDGKDLGADMTMLRASWIDDEVEPLSIATPSVPAASAGTPYSLVLAAQGGVPAYTWSVTAGTLPAGIALDRNTGEIGGVPTIAGDYVVTVRVTDASGSTASAPLTIRVAPAAVPLEIVTTGFEVGVVGVPFAAALEASGGSGPYAWTMTGGLLPSGLSLYSNGVVSGTPIKQGTSNVTISVADGSGSTAPVSRAFAITIAPAQNQPPAIALSAPAANAVVPVGATITLAASASDADGDPISVTFYVNDQPVGGSTSAGFTTSWLVPAPGTYRIHAIATDGRGASATSGSLSIGTKSEVVLYASEVLSMAGNYKLLADSTAAGGYALWNPNRTKRSTPKIAVLAAPGSYAEFTFFAEAGRPYQLWLRGRAEANAVANDSVFVQFDGVAGARSGTTGALTVTLEDGPSAGVAGWGWQDNGYGVGVFGAPVIFERTGLQKVRLQPREDGLVIDQIVLSPARFRTMSPGALKNDTTILPK